MIFICYDESTGAKISEGVCGDLDSVGCDSGVALIEVDRQGYYTHVRDGVPVSDPQPVTADRKLADIRSFRDILLQSCEWTRNPERPLTPEKKAEWEAYRAALFDFPATCDPFNPVWPVRPV